MLGIGALAAGGTVILPYKKKLLKDGFTSQVNNIRKNLNVTLQNHFDSELVRSTDAIRENISPYTRFVKYQRDHSSKTREDLSNLHVQLNDLILQADQEFKLFK